MTKMKSWVLVAVSAFVVFGAMFAAAFLGGVVVNQSYAVSQVVPINLGAGGVANLSAVVTYSSPAFSAAAFSTGQVSTGSVTIANNALLSTAPATNSIVVKSVSGTGNDFISMSCPIPPGAVVIRANNDWRYGATVSATATNIAAALTSKGACLGGVRFIASGSVVYATAPVGALYNSIAVVTNDTTTLTISTPTFLGGRNSTVFAINGTMFQANLNYNVGVTSTTSATNLAAAINAKASINKWVKATAGSGATAGIVSLQSKLAGAAYNFSLASSNSAGLSVFAPKLYGGTTPAWALNSTAISAPSHGFVTGLAVLYSTGGSPAITGLTEQTTYYVGVVDANDVALATTVARAAAGLFIPLASTSTLTAAAAYSLTPLAFATTAQTGFNWEVSNDGSNWVKLNVSSLTYTNPGSTVWSFGALPFQYLGLNLTAPLSGALTIKVDAAGN